MSRRTSRITFRTLVLLKIKRPDGTCESLEAHTLVVNMNGARIECGKQLSHGDSIEQIQVADTGAVTSGKVVWANGVPNERGNFEVGIELQEGRNLWGVLYAPEDWDKALPVSSASVVDRKSGNANRANSFEEPQPIIASESMRLLMDFVKRVAHTESTVLITGESGTGKELVARSIHFNSLRCSKAWVDVNAGAFPEHLIESELFGYEKGAFSGADTAKPGLLELADEGTLFLDEVGDLDARLQVKLLRILDGAPYFRLGGILPFRGRHQSAPHI